MANADDRDLHVDFASREGPATADPRAAFLDHVEAIPEFVAYKEALRLGLALRPGEVVLDIGCGLGTHARRIATEHDGPVFGLDRASMLAQARERTAVDSSVRWREGDATRLPWPDGSVHACLVERVLKYLPEPELAVSEIARVLHPEGRVGVFELDYDSMTLGGEDRAADAVQALLCDSVAQRRMGRRLPALLAAAGFTEIVTRPIAFEAPWPVHDMIIRSPARRGIEDGRLDRDSTQRWLDEQRPGAFTSIHVGVLVHGRRPTATSTAA